MRAPEPCTSQGPLRCAAAALRGRGKMMWRDLLTKEASQRVDVAQMKPNKTAQMMVATMNTVCMVSVAAPLESFLACFLIAWSERFV